MDNTKKAMLVALEKTYGRVSRACKMVDIARSTHYNWMNDDPDYKRAVDDINEMAIDFAEEKMYDLIDGAQYEALDKDGQIHSLKDKPNATAIIFLLKTKGKHRGYIEKQEIDMNVQPVVIQSAVDGSDTN